MLTLVYFVFYQFSLWSLSLYWCSCAWLWIYCLVHVLCKHLMCSLTELFYMLKLCCIDALYVRSCPPPGAILPTRVYSLIVVSSTFYSLIRLLIFLPFPPFRSTPHSCPYFDRSFCYLRDRGFFIPCHHSHCVTNYSALQPSSGHPATIVAAPRVHLLCNIPPGGSR